MEKNFWKLKITLIVILLAVGISARFTDLAWHFSHIDDLGVAKTILDEQSRGQSTLFCVPYAWTYAPFQFFFTQALISFDQPYRELLFWGRLPSFIFGSLGLLALILFYKLSDGLKSWKVVIALSLVALSWENIIFAKQMHNYALGVTAVVLTLILFIRNLKREEISLRAHIANGLILTLLCTMHYATLFFVPAFYLALYLNRHTGVNLNAIKPFCLSALIFTAGFFTTCFYFIQKHANSGSPIMSLWTRGPNGEFFFTLPSGGSVLENIVYTIRFFAQNFFTVLANNTTVVLPEHIFFKPLAWMCLVLFAAGSLSFIRTDDKQKRGLGTFLLIIMLSWFAVVLANRLTLSPTRHNLIYLPVMAVIIAEGFEFILKRLQNIKPAIYTNTCLLMILAFTTNVNAFLTQRHDPFNESEIMRLIESYQVDSVISAQHTLSIEVMKDLRDYYDFYGYGLLSHKVIARRQSPFKNIAWISHRQKLSRTDFEKVRNAINMYYLRINQILQQANKPLKSYMTRAFDEYDLVYKEESPSGIEIELAGQTKDGANNYYIYILSAKPSNP